MRNLYRFLLVIALSTTASTAQAIPLDFSFKVDWDAGFLLGSSSTVFVTLEGYTGTGLEVFRPGGEGLLAMSTTVDGMFFSELDDLDYPILPQIQLVDGGLIGSAFHTAVPYELVINTGGASYSTPTSGLAQGDIDTASFRLVESIPLPATLPLITLGIACLVYRRQGRVQTKARAILPG